MTYKKITLWSWLTKQEAKNEIFCPPDLQVSNEEFASELATQVETNRLPAQVELCEVNWDDTNTKQSRILIRHTGGGASTDVVQFLVGVDQFGNFTYVEEKVYLRPPELPRKPRTRKADKSKPDKALSYALMIGGGLFLLIAFVGLISRDGQGTIICCGVPGLTAAIVGFVMMQSQQSRMQEWTEIQDWNRKADEEQKLWDDAWNKWNKGTLEAAYLASTDDVFGRFTLAASSTVKQVIKKLFEDRQAELRERTQQRKTQKEIEEEIEKRKKDGFK